MLRNLSDGQSYVDQHFLGCFSQSDLKMSTGQALLWLLTVLLDLCKRSYPTADQMTMFADADGRLNDEAVHLKQFRRSSWVHFIGWPRGIGEVREAANVALRRDVGFGSWEDGSKIPPVHPRRLAGDNVCLGSWEDWKLAGGRSIVYKGGISSRDHHGHLTSLTNLSDHPKLTNSLIARCRARSCTLLLRTTPRPLRTSARVRLSPAPTHPASSFVLPIPGSALQLQSTGC
jgi:hypothetical protein